MAPPDDRHLPRTNANPFPAPFATHDPEWLNHYPTEALDALDRSASSADPSWTPGAGSQGRSFHSDPSCIFCQIVAGKRPSYEVYRDDKVMAFLDLFPLTEGHTLIIPLEHHPRLTAIPLELSQHLGSVVNRVSRAVVSSVHGEEGDSNGFNLLVNNGKVAGQVVYHTHYHVIPRSATDAARFRGGNLNRLKLTAAEARDMQRRIKEALAADGGPSPAKSSKL
ncbi:HIT-like domain-containing protein [Hyaloraphidium curvatum]|nr:HIT-like domain-containing protein [Hyaloraphidium curvatum]